MINCHRGASRPSPSSHLTHAPEREKERETRSEGTGIWPDYLVNRDDLKNEGPFGEKIAQISRNRCALNGRSCGCIGKVHSRHNST